MVELHDGAPDSAGDDSATTARNARIGMRLFVLYTVAYGVFIALNAFWAHLMEQVVWGGMNIAVLFGFGLILAAIVIALVYGWTCRNPASDQGATREDAR